MKNTTQVVWFLFLCMGCATKPAVNAIDWEGKGCEELTPLVFEKIKGFPEHTQISIALIKNGNPTYLGTIRKNDTVVATDNANNVFEIGSISKLFTTTLLATSVIEGIINLDDSINGHLDFPLRADQQISFRQLANHSSGLSSMPPFFHPDRYDEGTLITYLTQHLQLNTPPGETFAYSNLGMGLLGYTLSKNEGQSYETLIQRKICEPYGMAHTTTNRFKVSNLLVKGRSSKGMEVQNLDLGVLAGGGGILSNAKDLTGFVQAHLQDGNKALELTRIETFKRDEGLYLGLGWNISTTESEDTWYWHRGTTMGYTASLTMDVEHNNGVIILSNVSGYNESKGNVADLGIALMNSLATTKD